MGRRVLFFLAVNIVVMIVASTVITLVMNFLGLGPSVTAQGLNYTSLMVICLIWGMIGSFISLAMSKWLAKTTFGVKIVNGTGPYGEVVRKVHYLARRAGLSEMPEVGIYESPQVNAFATGMTKNNSLVAISTGAMSNLNEDELEGVLGHEVSHIANGDMVTMALVQGVVNAFVMFFARIVAFAIDNFLRGDDDEGGGLGFFAYFIVLNVLHVVFGILAAPIVYWFSRYREFRADAGSAKIAGKEKMIAALEGLKRTYKTLEAQPQRAHASTGNDRSIQTMQINGKLNFSEWFSTHPSLDKRIAALK